MGYFYSALWFVIAAVLLVRFRGEGKIIYILSGYFTVMGIWWLANQFVEVDLLSGVYGWILRGLSLAVLLILLGIYIYNKFKAEPKGSEVSGSTQESDEPK